MGKGTGRTTGGGGIVVEAASRKAKRKEARRAKKKRQSPSASTSKSHRAEVAPEGAAAAPRDGSSKNKRRQRSADAGAEGPGKRVKFSSAVEERSIPSVKNKIPTGLKKSRSSIAKESSKEDYYDIATYDHLDDETAMAFRKDDMEIRYLESELGIKGTKGSKGASKELNREYAKNEGFGDDFGEFLMGLDGLVERCRGGEEEGGGESEESDGSSDGDGSEDEKVNTQLDSDEEESDSDNRYNGEDPYAGLDEETALAFRGDDAEIARLEEKLGLATSKKAKKKLHKEFANTFTGYGEDFGDFLEGLEGLGARVGLGAAGGEEGSVDAGSVESESMDSGDGDLRSREELHGPSESDGSDDDSESEESAAEEADHEAALTYRPTSGEDIYGNKLDASGNNVPKPTKYVPPHLRKKLGQESKGDADSDASGAVAISSPSSVAEADPETIRRIQRSLNSQLNRLSEQTLESVSKSIVSLYSQYPFHDLNDCLWKNVQTAVVPPHMVMSGLIPLYIGVVAGVHWLGGDGIQLGGCLIEWSVATLHEALTRGRAGGNDAQGDEHEKVNKEASNLLLIACYLYNYGVVHCTLIYDLVRDFIACFSEIDVEALLLVLGHCGQQLRSDDPSALREIVLLVKERAKNAEEEGDGNVADSSRVQYLVDGIIELRNNKPRKQDVALREKTNALRKCVGRVKSAASQSLAGKKSASFLRVSLRDILDAETKGRWWIAGAQWAGNQYRGGEDAADDETFQHDAYKGTSSSSDKTPTEEDGLLSLAASQRMNTDARRSIFCIIMGSSDCEDAFEKLVRQGLLKTKAERDVVRVIVHCCGEEKAFNPFYAYLALRVCEYQHKSRFTLMLTFADTFKQLETCSVRKAANLAKLLAHLVGAQGKCLTLGVLKRIEFSPSDMPEMVVVFLSVFFTALFESLDIEDVERIFGQGLTGSSKESKRPDDSDDEDDRRGNSQTTKKEDLSDLRESLSVFLLQYLKQSPKNVKGSSFCSNYLAAQKACGSN